jgi:urea transport system ATP-binding protein
VVLPASAPIGTPADEKDFLLAVEALTVSFDGFKAVNDVSFYVDPDEIRVIIGPNGQQEVFFVGGRTDGGG